MTMKFKGTPGEWKTLPAEQGEHTFSHVIYAEGYGVVGYWKGHKDHHVNADWCLTKEDAQLISASKDLLAALSGIMNHHASSVLFHNKPMAEKAWAAIQKAVGQ